jgi:hypothetical protein
MRHAGTGKSVHPSVIRHRIVNDRKEKKKKKLQHAIDYKPLPLHILQGITIKGTFKKDLIKFGRG